MATEHKTATSNLSSLARLERIWDYAQEMCGTIDKLASWTDREAEIAYDLLLNVCTIIEDATEELLEIRARARNETSVHDDQRTVLAIAQQLILKARTENANGRYRRGYTFLQSAIVALEGFRDIEQFTEVDATPSPKRKTPDPPTGEAAADDIAAEEPPRNRPAVDPAPAPAPPSDPPAPRMRPVMSK